jgi:hypothetical protein
MTRLQIQILLILFLVLDLATVFLPMGSIGLVLIAFFRPRWFKTAVDRLYE